jgi:hypothetical protein
MRVRAVSNELEGRTMSMKPGNRLLVYVLAVIAAFAVWNIANPYLQRWVAGLH